MIFFFRNTVSFSFDEAHTILILGVVREPGCLLLVYSKRSKDIENKGLETYSKFTVIFYLTNIIIIMVTVVEHVGGDKKKKGRERESM